MATLILIGLVSAWLPRHYFHSTPDQSVPNWAWNDEADYWATTKTFLHRQFAGGYFGFNESPPKLPKIHFSVHGPGYAIVTGSGMAILRAFGLSGPQDLWPWRLNLFWISVALIAFCLLVRPEPLPFAATLFFLFTYWPIQLSLPSISQEGLHLAFAIVLAGLALRLWRNGPASSPLLIGGSLAFLLLASAVRLSWALLAIPAFLFILPPTGRRSTFLRLGIAAAGILALMAYWSIAVAPFPAGMKSFMFLKVLTGQQGIGETLADLFENARTFFDFRPHGDRGRILEILLRVQALGLMTFGAVSAWRSARSSQIASTAFRAAAFCAIFLGSLIVFILATYFVDRFSDYRILSGPVLLCALVMIHTDRRRAVAIAAVLVTLNLIGVQSFRFNYQRLRRGSFYYDAAEYAQAGREASEAFPYQRNADPWCNTVFYLTTARNWKVLYNLPAGIAYNFALGSIDNLRFPLRSRYVQMDPADFTLQFGEKSGWTMAQDEKGIVLRGPTGGQWRFDRYVSNSLGTFYSNPAAPCDRPAAIADKS